MTECERCGYKIEAEERILTFTQGGKSLVTLPDFPKLCEDCRLAFLKKFGDKVFKQTEWTVIIKDFLKNGRYKGKVQVLLT